MKFSRRTLSAVAASVLLLAIPAALFLNDPGMLTKTEPAAAPEPVPAPSHFVTLDKVVVMLRRPGAAAQPHFLSVDLVLATDSAGEQSLKTHLPLLRSVAVQALSSMSYEEAATLQVDQLANRLAQAFDKAYTARATEKPFAEVMIGKLIVE